MSKMLRLQIGGKGLVVGHSKHLSSCLRRVDFVQQLTSFLFYFELFL